MNIALRNSAVRLALAVIACVIIAGCGSQADRSSPDTSVTSSPSRTQGILPSVEGKKVELAAQANEMGEAPTAAGISLIDLPEVTAFLWESTQGHVCLWEAVLSGGIQTIKCFGTEGVKPKTDSKFVALHGPGALNDGARIVLLGDAGTRLTSAAYKEREQNSKFVRTLSAESGGREVYYVTMDKFPVDGWLDLTVQTGDQHKADRVSVAW